MVVTKKERRRRKRARKTADTFRPLYTKHLKILVIRHSMIKGAKAQVRQWLWTKKQAAPGLYAGLSEPAQLARAWDFNNLFGEIHMVYSPLVTSPDFDDHLAIAARIKPDVVVCHMGSNDLAKKKKSPGDLAELVIEKAQDLIYDYGVKEVVCLACLPRGRGVIGTAAQFETCHCAYNVSLRQWPNNH